MEQIITQENALDIIRDIKANGTVPIELWGKFIYKGEIAALFGDTNTGKSVLAMDIAIRAAGGPSYWFDPETQPLPVLYIDLEMSRAQFGCRYQGAADCFPKAFNRAEVDTLGGSEMKVLNEIINEITKYQNRADAPKLIVIDNYSLVGTIQSAKFAKTFMRELKALKAKYDLTILIIAHSIKTKRGTPITNDILGGSKMLVNFVDSAFALGNSCLGASVKYLKQTKTRMGAKLNDVATIEFDKYPYTHFRFVGMCDEMLHIASPSARPSRSSITPDLEPMVIQMRENGATYEEIAEELCLSKSAVGRYCKAVMI